MAPHSFRPGGLGLGSAASTPILVVAFTTCPIITLSEYFSFPEALRQEFVPVETRRLCISP